MGLGRAYGEGLNMANWLIQGYSMLQSYSWKESISTSEHALL